MCIVESIACRVSSLCVAALLVFINGSANFLEDQDVDLVPLGEDDDKRGKSWAPVAEETVLAALELIVDSTRYPLLIICSTGKHRTGENLQLPFYFLNTMSCSDAVAGYPIHGPTYLHFANVLNISTCI